MERKTPLYTEHVQAGARLVPFAGYLMPIQYSGILDEHRAVRAAMGMFDLSHMGEIRVTGSDAVAAVDRLVTNDIPGMTAGQVRYTPMCYPDGGIVDDLLVYRFPDHLMLVVNASNIEKDLDWIRGHVPPSVDIEDRSADIALIAVQGPKSEHFLTPFIDTELPAIAYYQFAEARCGGVPVILSRTGYTGEDGFELYLNAGDAPAVWQTLWKHGQPEGLKLVGLGARDTLRLEAGYMLYGNDIDATTTPLEAGLGWTVKFGDDDFTGRAALERQKQEGLKRRMVALEMLDRAIPRPHFSVFSGDQCVGELTSGTFSPTFERGIALGYVVSDRARAGTDVDVRIREAAHSARIVKKPMYRRQGG